jgi:eukaryotic-like serine/threonine-protein kinase
MASPAREASIELEALVGSTVSGKYRVDRMIGRGGMGAVFQATHLAIGKRVALKFLEVEAARDSDAATRFQREAEAASMVESAHIVQIFDSGTTERQIPFLVMELLTGEDLRARLKREGRLPVATVRRIGGQVLKALVRAHAAGIVHRDLKPDNVFLCRRDDDPEFVKIVDFGISKLARSATVDTLTQKGTVLGTAFYMSPEQAQSFPDIDGRTDLFSLGAILYEALAGRPPHTAPTYEAVLIAICTRETPDLRELNPEVPEELARVIHRALERNRDHRFQSASDFLEALEGYDQAPETKKEGAAKRAVSPEVRTARYRIVVGGIIAALAGFALAAYFIGKGEPQAEAEIAPKSIEPAEPVAAIQAAPPPSVSPAETAVAPAVKAKPVGPSPTPRPVPSAEVAKAAAKSGQGSAKPQSGVVKSLGLSNKEP